MDVCTSKCAWQCVHTIVCAWPCAWFCVQPFAWQCACMCTQLCAWMQTSVCTTVRMCVLDHVCAWWCVQLFAWRCACVSARSLARHMMCAHDRLHGCVHVHTTQCRTVEECVYDYVQDCGRVCAYLYTPKMSLICFLIFHIVVDSTTFESKSIKLITILLQNEYTYMLVSYSPQKPKCSHKYIRTGKRFTSLVRRKCKFLIMAAKVSE